MAPGTSGLPLCSLRLWVPPRCPLESSLRSTKIRLIPMMEIADTVYTP
jgi:hypothetical protein